MIPMRVMKKGKVVDIPVRAGTIAKTRESSTGRVTGEKVIVVKSAKPSDFSRAYGRQVLACTVRRGEAFVREVGAGDLYPVGKAKRVPKMCKAAALEYEARYKR